METLRDDTRRVPALLGDGLRFAALEHAALSNDIDRVILTQDGADHKLIWEEKVVLVLDRTHDKRRSRGEEGSELMLNARLIINTGIVMRVRWQGCVSERTVEAEGTDG